MPFTPFHFGPGLALKGVGAPVFSWSAFAAAPVLIDCETLYYLVRQEYPTAPPSQVVTYWAAREF